MSDGKNPDQGDSEVFEIERIRNLVELMKEHDLSEIDLRHSSRRIRVRRGQEATITQMPAMMPAAAQPAMPAPAPAAAEPEAPADDDNASYIKSPMVGTFYTSPKPGSPTFINIGDHVQADTIVCLVEAMKMFNEIPAGIAGKVTALVATNEEPVDVGKPLFRIIPD